MKFTVNRDVLVKPLQHVAGVVERRQTLPVLSNVLLRVNDGDLSITGTDLEVQMIANIAIENGDSGETTVAARKLLDICRELPEGANIEFSLDGAKLSVKSGRFRSALVTLPATEFPTIDTGTVNHHIQVPAKSLKNAIDRTAFAMAQQDVRYFLNGLLLEVEKGLLRCVATDGHRLALCDYRSDTLDADDKAQIIVPRKGVQEMQRLLSDHDADADLSLGANYLALNCGSYALTTKLIDGRFPDYDRVIPKDGTKSVLADKVELRQALNRTAILSNEKFRGIRLNLSDGLIEISANNPEQEEAEESVVVEYQGESLEIGFNVSYLQDVLAVISADKVKITLNNASASALLEEPEEEDATYVVMPMKL